MWKSEEEKIVDVSENRHQLAISSHSSLQSLGSRPEKHAAPAPTRPEVGYKSQSRYQMFLTANINIAKRKQPPKTNFKISVKWLV